MNLHFTDIEVVQRCRRTDPSTSVAAAERTKKFANSHADRCLVAIRALTAVGSWATQNSIAQQSGLSSAAVGKRLPEMERAGLIKVLQAGAGDLEYQGCRCWGIA